jgi:predicted MFS family arabinose efflux permease
MHLQRKDVAIMAICTGLIVANIYYIQPLIVLVSKEFNIPENVAGSAAYLTQAGYAAGLLLLVPLGDMMEKRKQILLVTSIAVLSLIGVAVAPAFWIMQVACFMLGLSSIVPQLILPLAANLADAAQRGKVIGSVMSGLLIGILLSRTLSGAIGAWLGWRSMFWIAAAICIIIIAVIYKRFPKNHPSFSGHYGTLMRSLLTLVKTQPVLREATAISMCSFAVFGSFWTTMVLLFSNEPYHFTSDQIGLFGLAGAAGALAAPLVGGMGDKGNLRRTISIGLGIFLFSLLLLYFSRYYVIGFVIGIILIDVGQQAIHVSNQTRVYALIPGARNRLNTVYMSCSFAGTATGSAIGLYLWKHFNWAGVIAGNIVLTVIAILVLIFSTKRQMQNKNAMLETVQ